MESLYFIAITLPEEAANQITEIKKEIAHEFGTDHALRSPPHITLHMPFKWKDSKMDILHEALGKTAIKFSPFDIELRNFGCFAPRVIYVKVNPSDRLDNLFKQIQDQARKQLNLFNADHKGRGFHPHVTVAFRDLRKTVFHLAWQTYQERKLSIDFECGDLTLLKHDGKRWNPDHFYGFS